MSENTNNEKNILANLAKGETLIPKKYVEKIEESNTILTPEVKEKKPSLGYLAGGIMSSTTVLAPTENKTTSNVKKVAKKETVALYSTRNVTWNGVGKVYIGYNIVSSEAADKWLARDHVRIATPEEVAREYGK